MFLKNTIAVGLTAMPAGLGAHSKFKPGAGKYWLHMPSDKLSVF